MAPGIYLSGRLHRVRNFPHRLEKLICTTSRDNILELSAPRGLSTSNISLHKWILFICMLEHICFWTLVIFWSGVDTILLSYILYERRKSNTDIIHQYRTFDPSQIFNQLLRWEGFCFHFWATVACFWKAWTLMNKTVIWQKKWYLWCMASPV